MKYFLSIFGCQMNKSDAERIASVLESIGWTACSKEEDADLIVVIACSVRQTAIDRVYGRALKYAELKKKKPNLKTILTGCVLDFDKKKLSEKFNMVCDIREVGILPLFLKWVGCPQGRRGIEGGRSPLLQRGAGYHTKNFGVVAGGDFSTAQLNQFSKPFGREKIQNALTPKKLTPTLLPTENPPLSAPKKGGVRNRYSYLSIPPKYQSSFQAYVPIMTGCNNFCSYCVVPHTRGREYSRPEEDILNEVKHLIQNGYKEITLIGQNVNSYRGVIINQTKNKLSFRAKSLCRALRRDEVESLSRACRGKSLLTKSVFTNRKRSLRSSSIRCALEDSVGMTEKNASHILAFPALLRLINSIPGDFWIRFATSHPKDMSDELINAIAECEKITPYIHIPIQAGSDKILKAMNRKYTKKHYLDLIKKIKKKIPAVMLSTDIIVGFPGETEEDFEETVAVFKKIKYTMAYIARYSPRPGTAASKMPDNVNHEEKARREHILTEILKGTALENNKKFIGKTVRVLIERQGEDIYFGKTAQFVNVKINQFTPFIKEGTAIGQFVNVKITNATSFGMEGAIN